MLKCRHGGTELARTRLQDRSLVILYGCEQHGCCTAEPSGLSKDGRPIQSCWGSDGRPCGDFLASTSTGEPVGDMLRDVLKEIGITRTCKSCEDMRRNMNDWGIAGCNERRSIIVQHLKEQRRSATWSEAFAAARRLYLTEESLLDEAIRLAAEAAS